MTGKEMLESWYVLELVVHLSQLLNENQKTPSSYFQVDADFFDLSDPEKQKDVDTQKR